MQKRFLTVLAATLAAALLFSSCSKSNKQGRYIPSTAGVVFHINGKSLNEKLPWDEVKQNDLFKEMMADSSLPDYAKAILNNPDSGGVDIKSDMEIFVVRDSTGGYAGLEGTIKDKAKFKSFLGIAAHDAKETSKDDYTYLTSEKASVGYNKDMFIVTINLPQMNDISMMHNTPQWPTDSVFGGMDEVKYDRDMAAVTASLFNLAEDKSLAKNDHFSELMGTSGDAHAWFSAENMNLGKNMNMGAMAALVNTDKLTKDVVSTATANFENGRISVDLKSYGGKELTDLYKKYNGGSFDKSMIKNLPSKNIAGMFIMNFKPEGLQELLRLMNMDGLANMGLAQAHFNLDDFVKANKGDIMFAVTDLKKDTGMTKPDAQYFFSASIGDKESFNKLINGGKKLGGMMQAYDSTPKIFYNTNDKYFILSNNKDAGDTYLAGTANNSFAFLDNISGGPMGGYVNFQYIMTTLRAAEESGDSMQIATYDASLKMWDNMLISGGDFKDGGLSQHWEINLMDKNTNSLKQLNVYAGVMGAIEKARRKKIEANWNDKLMNPNIDEIKIDSPPPAPALHK